MIDELLFEIVEVVLLPSIMEAALRRLGKDFRG